MRQSLIGEFDSVYYSNPNKTADIDGMERITFQQLENAYERLLKSRCGVTLLQI